MKLSVFCIFLLASGAALAQQPQQGDPALGVCQQLSMQKEAQIIQIAVQVQNLSKQLEEAKAELTKLKAPPPTVEEKK